jgi:hypothetical protein
MNRNSLFSKLNAKPFFIFNKNHDQAIQLLNKGKISKKITITAILLLRYQEVNWPVGIF